MSRKLKFVAKDLKRDLRVYQLALRDPRTPKAAKAILRLSLAYASLPWDIIPDFIPIVGHMDDAFVVPVLIRVALRIIPQEVIDDCRNELEGSRPSRISASKRPRIKGRREGAGSARPPRAGRRR